MKKYVFYGITLAFWVFCIVMWVNGMVKWLLPGLIVLHLVETFLIGYRTGKAYGASDAKNIAMNMLYGIFWWNHLRKEMAEKAEKIDLQSEL